MSDSTILDTPRVDSPAMTARADDVPSPAPPPTPPEQPETAAGTGAGPKQGGTAMDPDLLRLASQPPNIANPTLIRAIDLIGATLLVLLFFIPGLLIALTIRVTSRGPIIYRNPRVGRRGASFKVWKFRTMVTDAEARLDRLLASDPDLRREYETTRKLKKDPRVTSIGRLLRATSLDEIPQIYNVLAGHMSLVGPRPPLIAEIPLLGAFGELIFEVRPGLTGPWQISGRSDTTYAERTRLDLEYARNHSVMTYFSILVKTPIVMLRGSAAGAY